MKPAIKARQVLTRTARVGTLSGELLIITQERPGKRTERLGLSKWDAAARPS
jgi:hypothetical protein